MFRFGVELFPENANLYDGLGEAHTSNADFPNAVKAYEKSISLNPVNVAGKKLSRN